MVLVCGKDTGQISIDLDFFFHLLTLGWLLQGVSGGTEHKPTKSTNLQYLMVLFFCDSVSAT